MALISRGRSTLSVTSAARPSVGSAGSIAWRKRHVLVGEVGEVDGWMTLGQTVLRLGLRVKDPCWRLPRRHDARILAATGRFPHETPCA